MDGLGEQVLARAALPVEHHGEVGEGGLLAKRMLLASMWALPTMSENSALHPGWTGSSTGGSGAACPASSARGWGGRRLPEGAPPPQPESSSRARRLRASTFLRSSRDRMGEERLARLVRMAR